MELGISTATSRFRNTFRGFNVVLLWVMHRIVRAHPYTSFSELLFLHQLVKQVLGRPLRLDLSALYSGLDDIIHDLAWHEWPINTQRLLNGVDGDGSRLSEQIKELYGSHVSKAFDEWTQAIAQGDRSNVESFACGAMKWFAGNIGLTAMVFSVSSAVSQITGTATSSRAQAFRQRSEQFAMS